MKKQTMLLLLSTLMLGACQSPVENSSSSLYVDTSSKTEDVSSPLDSSSPSQEETSISSSVSDIDSSSIDETPPLNDGVKRVTNYLGSDNDVYRINIKTENNEFPIDKENYVNGSLNITEQDTSIVKNEDMSMRIKLRGNSTLGAAKKPFKIKFDSKQSLFGLEKAKDWVLLANYYDKSNIRNYLAYLTANKMSNLDFQPSSIFVDVYFNDEYYGLFLLTEQMEAKTGRVDIEKNVSAEGINSFLLEADERAKDEYSGYQGKAYITSGRYDFALKSPDADDYVEALADSTSGDLTVQEEAKEILKQFDKDAAWLQNFMDKTSEAIYSSQYSEFSKFIDIESFVDYYLVQEFFKNVDVGSTSQYYVIDQNQETVKLSMGPVWDFDIAAGVVDLTSPDSVYTFYSSTPLFTKARDYYYKALFENSAFYSLVVDRYTQLREDVFVSILKEFDIVTQALEKAQQRNIERWPLQAPKNTWIEQHAMSETYYQLESLQAHYDLLKDVLNDRIALLDAEYLREEQQ